MSENAPAGPTAFISTRWPSETLICSLCSSFSEASQGRCKIKISWRRCALPAATVANPGDEAITRSPNQSSRVRQKRGTRTHSASQPVGSRLLSAGLLSYWKVATIVGLVSRAF
ncbi:hypothetical protein IF1G_09839 [Cordyceps javanica]|uniref:Uncharacterized protein n=1 Tax=Cordyceps javanica TaxID=43265 RepID=A0A545UPF3_9HYPO|nr:hypothetical protein IF1G_09839 [Cordyceps javanica]